MSRRLGEAVRRKGTSVLGVQFNVFIAAPQGDLEGARLHYEQALAIFRTARGNDSQEVGACLTYVCRVLYKMVCYDF